MTDRITPLISGLPKRHHRDLLSYLQKNPEFTELKNRLHLDSPDGGQSFKRGSVSGSLSLSCYHRIYRYRDYLVTIDAVLGQIHITCEKVTQELLFKKYEELNDFARELVKKESEIEIELKTRAFYDRIALHREFTEKFRENKRRIKKKLIELGIKVAPGSDLSKLLRLDK